jgi:hypothetical protein
MALLRGEKTGSIQMWEIQEVQTALYVEEIYLQYQLPAETISTNVVPRHF